MIRSGLDTKEISTLSAGAVFDQPPSAMKVRWGATFFWLSAFYLVYCARPEDWIPGLRLIPLAKLTAIPALILLFSIKTGRKFRDRPVEANYLFILIVILFASAAFSPLWRGGAFYHTLDFFQGPRNLDTHIPGGNRFPKIASHNFHTGRLRRSDCGGLDRQESRSSPA